MDAKAGASTTVQIEVEGNSFHLRTSDRLALERSLKWLKSRLVEYRKNHPLLKPTDIYLLALIEMSYERQELGATGKALLKQTDQLIEWLDQQQ